MRKVLRNVHNTVFASSWFVTIHFLLVLACAQQYLMDDV